MGLATHWVEHFITGDEAARGSRDAKAGQELSMNVVKGL